MANRLSNHQNCGLSSALYQSILWNGCLPYPAVREGPALFSPSRIKIQRWSLLAWRGLSRGSFISWAKHWSHRESGFASRTCLLPFISCDLETCTTKVCSGPRPNHPPSNWMRLFSPSHRPLSYFSRHWFLSTSCLISPFALQIPEYKMPPWGFDSPLASCTRWQLSVTLDVCSINTPNSALIPAPSVVRTHRKGLKKKKKNINIIKLPIRKLFFF